MESLYVFGFIIFIAFAGGIYFVIQDRKAQHEHDKE